MTTPATPVAGVLYVHFHGRPDEETYARLLAVLTDLTPTVQPLPPDAAYADVTGSLRYFRLTAPELASRTRVRTLVLMGIDCTIGVARNPLLATMAAHDGPPGAVRALAADDGAVAGFLHDQPAGRLPGIGTGTARQLAAYGLTTLGQIAAAPPATLQRILGAQTGRRIHEAARGHDPARVAPAAPPRTLRAEHGFPLDELDRERQRSALLTLVDELGHRLRADEHVTRRITLTVRFADRTVATRTRTLPEPTAHTRTLLAAVYRMHDALGLQRARVRALEVQAGELHAAELACRQLTFDPGDEAARRIEAAADHARERFGPHTVRPAAALTPQGAPDTDAA